MLAGDDGLMHLAAHHGAQAERLRDFYARGVPAEPYLRGILDRHAITLDNVFDASTDRPLHAVAAYLDVGPYSIILAPMTWEGRAVGFLYVTRQPATGFAAKETALLESFADQATISIQNARLFNETKEALERQTATSEVLRVISESPTDVQPVFDSIVASAKRLLPGSLPHVTRYVDGSLHLVAFTDAGEDGEVALHKAYPLKTSPGGMVAGALESGDPIHVLDIETDPRLNDVVRASFRMTDIRSSLTVPMRSKGQPLGTLVVNRTARGGFTEREVALVRSFADQAVIAIENVRLFNETKEALERQTATTEVLQAINASPGDLVPVFDAIVQKARHLVDASHGRTLAGRRRHGAFRRWPRRQHAGRLFRVRRRSVVARGLPAR